MPPATVTSPQPARAFTVTSGVDTTAPAVTITVPTPNQSFPNAPITFSGTATDNLGVTRVDVDIKNRTTGLWLRNDGSWGAFQVAAGRRRQSRCDLHVVELQLDATRGRRRL